MHCCARHTAQLFKKFREAVVDKVSATAVRWKESEITTWIQSRPVAVATVDVNSPRTTYATM